jgi:hypothetical protein
MGNQISRRHLLLFIEDNTIGNGARMTSDDDTTRSVSWLSYLCAFWVWEDDANGILKYLRDAQRVRSLNDECLSEKSVIDIVYAAKQYRSLQNKPHMTDEELVRFRIFSKFRNARGSRRYPVFTLRNETTGHIMEYIKGRQFVKRYDS